MADSAHVQTKSQIPIASSRDITTTLVQNPTSDDIANYNTALDPSVVSGKDNKLDLAAVDLNNEPIPLWYSKYGTGLEEAEIFYKTVLYSNGKQVVITGDQPYVFDIGPTVDLPDLDAPPSLDDAWHKDVVTGLIPIDVDVASGVFASEMVNMGGLRDAQYMLFPVSSRHLCKTSDGSIHAVVSYDISGLSRIVYLKSINGGAVWTSTIVDQDDGRNYVLPSITCDSSDTIHITWSRWDHSIGYTYWLFVGSTIPDGFECISDDSSGNAYQRLLGGGSGSYSLLYGDDATHDHAYVASGGAPSACVGVDDGWGDADPPSHAFPKCSSHHYTLDVSDGSVTALPISGTVRLIRYNGFPDRIPVDVVLMFDTVSIPDYCTRYSYLDNKFILLSDTPELTFGSNTHNHSYTYTLSGNEYAYGDIILAWMGPPPSYVCYSGHSHSGSFSWPTSASNDPPGHTVVLAKVLTEQTVLPPHSIIMCDSNGLIDSSLDFTSLSDSGEELYAKYLKGGTSYVDVAGSISHDHGGRNDDTTYCPSSIVINMKSGSVGVTSSHYHDVTFTSQSGNNYIPSFAPSMYHTDSDYDLSSVGNDIFHRSIDSLGVLGSVSPITEYHDGIYQTFACTCLCDLNNNVHFMWCSQGINTTLTNARVCYRQMVDGVLGSIEYPITDDVNCSYSSFDIDFSGRIHAVWWVLGSSPKIQYNIRDSSWGITEDIDTSQYVAYPSNVVVDSMFNVYVQYAYYSNPATGVSDVYYCKRTVGVGWGTPVNLTPGKLSNSYNQFPGQTYIDNKGNVVFTFTGKGYCAHTTVHHPVYRYLTPDGDVIPSLLSDAEDIFPDDDNEIIYPSVFWHTFPLVSSVYHNLPVAGMTFMYLYNVRGVDYDTADIKFYSSPNALVGDVGSVGSGGSGDGDFSPGGVGAETLLQFESFRTTIRGYIGKTSFINDWGGYVV